MADTDIRKSFHQQLDEVQHDLVRMAALVTEALDGLVVNTPQRQA